MSRSDFVPGMNIEKTAEELREKNRSPWVRYPSTRRQENALRSPVSLKNIARMVAAEEAKKTKEETNGQEK